MDDRVWVLAEDVLTGLAKVPSGSVSLCIADPDWRIKDETSAARKRNRMKFTKEQDGLDWHREGDPVTIDDQRLFMAHWMFEVHRVLKPGGHLVCWFDAQRITHVYDSADGTWTRPVKRQNLIWAKAHPVPRGGCVNFMRAEELAAFLTKDGLAAQTPAQLRELADAIEAQDFEYAAELAAWITKDSAHRKAATFNAELGQCSNVQTCGVVRGHARIHPAQKPVPIIEWLVSYLSKPGDIVLDLFAGSFTTSKVAAESRRTAIAIDRDAQCYLKMFEAAEIPARPAWVDLLAGPEVANG